MQKNKKSSKYIILAIAGVAIIAGGIFLTNNPEKSPIKMPKMPIMSGDVVAKVNGAPIYLSEVKALVAQTPQLAELSFEVIYPQVLNEMINAKVFEQAAKESNLKNDVKIKQAVEAYKDKLIAQTYLQQKIEALATPEKLKELYLVEIQNFKRPEEIHARHILVKTEKDAKDILMQLKAGADFKTLANTKSLDAETTNGGDLGYFQENMMIPEFAGPVFKLSKGAISQPIKTPFGWHIVMVEDKRLATPPAFEDVQEQLVQLFFEKNKQAIVDSERKHFNVEVVKPSIVSVPEKTAPVAKETTPAESDKTPAVAPKTPATPAATDKK